MLGLLKYFYGNMFNLLKHLFDTSVLIMEYLFLNFHQIHRKGRKTVYAIPTTTIRNLLFSLMVGQIGQLYIFRHQDFSL